MRKSSHLILSSIVSLALVGVTPLSVLADSKQDINQYFQSLTYEPQEILTNEGEYIDNPPATTGMLENGRFVVLRREKKNITNNSADIAVIDAKAANIYPGALLRADQNLLDNNPTLISIARGDLTLSLNLPGLANGDSHTVVNSPTRSTVRTGVNNLLSKWNNTYAGEYGNTQAELQYDETMAYSMSQLKTKFGTSFEKIAVPLDINFDAVNSGEKQVQIVNFKQIYYTVSVDEPESPSKLFAEWTTVEDLKRNGITDEVPPVYVSSVSYGRSMFIKLETSSRSTQVQAAFKAAIKGVDISGNAEYQDILKNTSFSAYIFGGDAGSAATVVSGNIETLKKIIEEGARYGKLNPGVPISYSTNFVKDNRPAQILSNSEYIETTSTVHNSSALTLDHSGAYVAKYNITWEEVSYNEAGEEVWEPKAWDKNGVNLTSHWSETIQIPGNARNLHVNIQECTGLAWEWWRTVYDKDLPLVGQRKITIWGTTLYPQYADEVIE
ncbi:TPA: cholesterol-dependent cytolysin suilysin [Streptococcus suis]|nr:cholesterol-dependent cytolysin suilysin [Streptococcus suis]